MIPALRPQNLLELLSTSQKCTTGCPILDRTLNGGIPCNSITEIVAESGSGKTQLCLQLTLHAQLPISNGGLNASSLYLHTEFPFPFRRLHQLSSQFHSPNPQNPCDNIFVQSIYDAHQLLDEMSKSETFIEKSKSTLFPIRVIIIDSIAALFRSEFDNTPIELKKRSELFFRISSKLKQLAKKFNLVVMVTNQVGDLIEPDEGISGVRIGNLKWLITSGRRVCPALGLAWANCVNSRLFLSRNEEVVNGEDGRVCEDNEGGLVTRMRRRVHVVFAPHLRASECEFVIKREGVFGIER